LKGLELQKQLASKIKSEYEERAKMASKKLKAQDSNSPEPGGPILCFPQKARDR